MNRDYTRNNAYGKLFVHFLRSINGGLSTDSSDRYCVNLCLFATKESASDGDYPERITIGKVTFLFCPNPTTNKLRVEGKLNE